VEKAEDNWCGTVRNAVDAANNFKAFGQIPEIQPRHNRRGDLETIRAGEIIDVFVRRCVGNWRHHHGAVRPKFLKPKEAVPCASSPWSPKTAPCYSGRQAGRCIEFRGNWRRLHFRTFSTVSV